MAEQSESRTSVYGALVANIGIAVTKLIAAYLSRSSAMLSEGIHSLVDSGNELLLLFGLKRSKLPSDDFHPFGHSSEIYFWGLIVAVLIFGIGGGVSIYEGITRIVTPKELVDPTVNYIVLSIALVMECFSFGLSYRSLRRTSKGKNIIKAYSESKDPTIFTVLAEDAAAITGITIAFVGVFLASYFNNSLYDGLGSILIGAVLIIVASELAYESKGLLVGESVDEDILKGVREITSQNSSVVSVNKLLTMHLGPNDVLLTMQIKFRGNLPGDEITRIIADLKEKIKTRYPVIRQIYLEPIFTYQDKE